jgi:Ser/Thr protein kinase RdoA (MazF antagonist)
MALSPYDRLTRLGQARRLRRAAEAALATFDLDVAELGLLGTFTNTLFRVRSAAGASYVVRCSAPGWRTETDLNSEALWLEALARDTEIGAPVPLRSREGEAVMTVRVEGVPGARLCTVMSWIPGTLLGQRLSTRTMSQMGELSARLHAHGAAFVPPEGFTTRKMRSYLARDEADVLFSPPCIDALFPAGRELLELTRVQVEAAFDARYADPVGLRVIHNDLWHDNIKVDRGRLRPLDFEDTLWGYPVQDIAMAFQDLVTEVPADDYEAYREAFREGYEREGVWPEGYAGEMDAFQAGRMLWVANYVAAYETAHLQGYIEGLLPWLEGYLTSGRVRKPEAGATG